MAQENTKVNMEKMPIFKEHNGVGLPKRTFKDKMTIGKGADQVDLYYFGPGHTNGDAFVVFPALRIMHAGDIFARKAVPLIDPANGGSMLHISETLMKAHDGIKNVDAIINGHTPAQTTWADLKEFSQFNKDLVDWMRAGLKAGKTPEQLAANGSCQKSTRATRPPSAPMMGGLAGPDPDPAEGNSVAIFLITTVDGADRVNSISVSVGITAAAPRVAMAVPTPAAAPAPAPIAAPLPPPAMPPMIAPAPVAIPVRTVSFFFVLAASTL